MSDECQCKRDVDAATLPYRSAMHALEMRLRASGLRATMAEALLRAWLAADMRPPATRAAAIREQVRAYLETIGANGV